MSSQHLAANTAVTFTLKNGSKGIIAPEARRTYDHIIGTLIKRPSLTGPTDDQVKLILEGSRLSLSDIENIWESTEKLDAPPFEDGSWTSLEIYYLLDQCQTQERLSLNGMAIQYCGSLPPETTSRIRRRSSYAEAGLSLRRPTEHDPMPGSPISPSTPPRHSMPYISETAEAGISLEYQGATTQVKADQDDRSVSQAGLEPFHPSHIGASLHHGDSENMRYSVSQRTDFTADAQRLATLIESRCPNIQKERDIEKVQPTQPRVGLDDSRAHDMLVRIRRQNPKFKDPSKRTSSLIKSKKAKQKMADSETWDFYPHEKSLALREVIEGSNDVSIAKALIDMGADVRNFHSRKPKIIGSLDESVPINYAKIATSNNHADMVSCFLASNVPLNYLVEALKQAVDQNLPNIVLILLQNDVDPNCFNGAIFESALASHNPVLVRLLLRSRTKVRREMLTRHLPSAVERDQTEIVSLLMLYGADPNHDNASALRKAVRAQRIDLVLAIIKSIDGAVKSDIASSVIVEAFQPNSSLNGTEQRLLIEILLCAGAKGNGVAQILLPIVRARRRTLVELLIRHGVDLNYNDGEALRHAVASNNLEILSKLLVGNVSTEIASDLIDEIPATSNEDQMLRTLKLLLGKGAKGSPLDRALQRAVQRRSTTISSLLLDHQAKVDVDDSQPLRIAVTNSDLATLDMLLAKGRPRLETLQVLLPLIPRTSPQLRTALTRSIVNSAGRGNIPTTVLNEALLQAVRHPLQDIDKYLIPLVEILVDAGAEVDIQQGECFRKAAEFESMKLLELLMRHAKEPSSLLPALPVCMKMSDRNQRRIFVSSLLKRTVKGTQIDQALVDAIEESGQDESLIALLLPKANMEYHKGEALSATTRLSSAKLLSNILNSVKTSQKTRARAAQTLLEPGVKERTSKANILFRSGIGQDSMNNALIQEMEGERDAEILRMLLDCGASCTFDDGKSLSLAILHQDNDMLKELVSHCPDRQLLARKVSKSSKIEDPTMRHTCLDVLIQGGAVGEPLSYALVEEIEKADHGDHRIIQLLVTKGAAIDYLSGRAIKFVVKSLADAEILKILVQGPTARATVNSLIPLAMAHRQDKRLPLLQILLDKGASGDHVDAALIKAVTEGSKEQSTIELLLKYNASVEYHDAAALKIAAQTHSSVILELLLSKKPQSEHCEEALGLAMQASSSLTQTKSLKRLDTVRLLTKPTTFRFEIVDSPLVQAVQEGDHDLIEHLINIEADPNFQEGSSVVAATQRLDVKSLHLLASSKFKLTPQTCSKAFAIMLESRQINPETAKEFDRVLISGGAAGPAMDRSFLNAMQSSHALAKDFLNLVLKYRTELDVEFEGGRSLCIAVRRARFESVKFLLSRSPCQKTLQAAFLAIFESGADEVRLIKLVQLFLGHSGDGKGIYFQREKEETMTDVLYQTLHRHGDKPKLLQTLLDNGCRTTSIFRWTFDENLGNENASELLWLLCQETGALDSQIIGILLKHRANPNFRTIVSGNTPLIRAAHLKQPEILIQLLDSGAMVDMQDRMERTALQHAVLADNLEGVKILLERQAEVNESLHVASRLLNLSILKLLLDYGAYTNSRGTVGCEGRIPIAELCRNADLRDNPPELRKTIRYLCTATQDLRVRTADGKSLIFQALDNPWAHKMTPALFASCITFENELNDDYNIYARGSHRYSPTAYVRHFKCFQPIGYRCLDLSQQCCDLDNCPAPDLEKVLHSYNCKDRFWDDQAGTQQPKGFCDPPQAIASAIEAAEARRLESEHQARVNAEENARNERNAAKRRAQKEQEKREKDAEEQAELIKADEALARELHRNFQLADGEARRIDMIAKAEQRAIQVRTNAELHEKALLAEAAQREDENRKRLEQQQYQEEIARDKEKDRQQILVLKERANVQVDQKKREANIEQGVLKEQKAVLAEKKRMLESGAKLYREVGYSGAGRGNIARIGRITGEIEDA